MADCKHGGAVRSYLGHCRACDFETGTPAESPPTNKCRMCGESVTGEWAKPAPDPFAFEIHDDETPVVMCGECREERAMEI